MIVVPVQLQRDHAFAGEVLSLVCEEDAYGRVCPILTRDNVAKLIKWLWQFDPSLTYEQDENSPRQPFLLDDLMAVLPGGIFAVMYPTDYGKSTLVDADTVLAIVLWPDTFNIIIKRTKDAAADAAASCYWKLSMASEFFPHCQPMARLNPSNRKPEVKNGFFVVGNRFRQLGARDYSVYPAGIGDGSVQGRRGRTKIDDIEDENTMKSEAKTDTVHKNVNNSVRNYEDSDHGCWLIAGTPQGANSVMYSVDEDLNVLGKTFRVIARPEIIQTGADAGKLLWPKRKIKSEVQRRLMDPTAHAIAYALKPPGSDRYNGTEAVEKIKDPAYPRVNNQAQLREYLFGRIYQDYMPRIGFVEGLRRESDLYAFCELRMSELALYIGWDAATTGTFAQHLLAMLPDSRWIVKSRISSAASDQQAEELLDWWYDFPEATVVLERNGQQDAFATILMMINSQVPVAPHTTTSNKHGKDAGIPGMMKEVLQGRWHLPWDDDDECDAEFGHLLLEIKRWGPVSHPHGIPSLWFPWYFDRMATNEPSDEEKDWNRRQSLARGEVPDAEMFDVLIPNHGLRDTLRRSGFQTASEKAWSRRWPSVRR